MSVTQSRATPGGKAPRLYSRFFNPVALRFLGRRLVQALIVMLMVVIANFVIIKLAPGDMVDVLSGNSDMTAEQIAGLRTMYGLDQPILIQLGKYLGQLLTFNLGYSFRNAAPVLDIIMLRLPTTAMLVVLSVIISLTVGTVLGVVAARRAGKPADAIISTVALLFYATPSFIVAISLILIFSVKLGWLPIAGLTSVGANYTGMRHVLDVVAHLVMPVTALCTFYIAIYGRLARATMLEVMSQDFVRTARAKGMSERRVIYGHALRNALMPLVTMAGLQVSSLIGGAVLVETVFGLPGMGRTAFDAVFERDANLLLGVMFISSLSVVVVSLVVDILYVIIDPRVELK
ncbi:ABC transporter permease [Mesorhizobium sp. YR577]|uniref:ABC transporter permease n=1 Tax=Mesorhizobium sp. YR577 TaxID=1884373 RepID=UPI0008DEB862|nr:ABC transporter permease [Mesorhizobium sp. YR577]SFU22403.1 peptide/nickel transport system permease protein [Mesorhizobium sp. YR577]